MKKLYPAVALLLLFACVLPACRKTQPGGKKYLFFLHNRFLELEGLQGVHPQYGRCEYAEIVAAFKNKGFEVISELRPRDADADFYAQKVAGQADSLLKAGVRASDITIVGTSKGGYIARLAAGMLKNKDINFVFVGCCNAGDNLPPISGNVLSIYEQTDTLGQSCRAIKEMPGNNITRFEEIELNTGMRHGFLYKAMGAWLQPTMQWAREEHAPARAEQPAKADNGMY